jgi:hypothetical protein
MGRWDIARYALISCVAAALLAGCGEPSLSEPGYFTAPARGRDVKSPSASYPETSPLAKALYRASSPLMFVVNFISASGAGNVVIYDPKQSDPTPLAIITTGVFEPNGACVDANGTVYVESQGTGTGWLSEYSAGQTKPFKVITDGLDGPAFCAIDAKGNLWVTNHGGNPNVTEYLQGSAEPHATITNGLSYPIGIAFDHQGNLYVGNHVLSGTTNVQVYSPGSTSPTRTITDGVVWPVGIAVDSQGTLYVANDNKPCNVEEYREGQAHPYRAITRDINGPAGLSIGENGWLYVSNEGAQGCSGPWPVLLEFRPDSTKPSRRMISKELQTPVGNAHYPSLLP